MELTADTVEVTPQVVKFTAQAMDVSANVLKFGAETRKLPNSPRKPVNWVAMSVVTRPAAAMKVAMNVQLWALDNMASVRAFDVQERLPATPVDNPGEAGRKVATARPENSSQAGTVPG